jgi:diguanylate cyclase (GGDEF)-like protein
MARPPAQTYPAAVWPRGVLALLRFVLERLRVQRLLPRRLAWPRLALVLLAALPHVAGAATPEVLTLAPGQHRLDVWPAVQVAFDPDGEAGWAALASRPGAFATPEVPAGNFGSRRDAVWLRFVLKNLSDDPRRILHIDYPMLQRIDVYLVRDGVEHAHHRLGSALPFDQRPLPTRAHAVALDLPPGTTSTVYLRVETDTAMLVPMTLLSDDGLLEAATDHHLLQGLLTGLALALFVYSLFNAAALRDLLFLQYAVMVASVTVFFSVYFGLAQQYLWPTPGPWSHKAAPLAMLVMLCAASPFVAGALEVRRSHPWLHRALWGLAAVAAGCFVLSLAGVLDYRQTQVLASSLGPVPLLLTLPVAVSRVRHGDVAARWLVLGWSVYLVGAMLLLALLRGLLPTGFWTLHAFQFATMVEMIVWVRVLGVRLQMVRHAAERAELERSTLLSMAETDVLTSLPNRRGLQRVLTTAVQGSGPDRLVAVYLLDLDGFKPVNDRLGHDAGDDLLVQVGRRLRGSVRASDVVARLGGDEFVVVSTGLAAEAGAKALGAKLRAAFDAPFVVHGQTCAVGASIGYALAPHDGREPGDLLRRADAAMYAGKQAGGRRVSRGAASAGLAGGPA